LACNDLPRDILEIAAADTIIKYKKTYLLTLLCKGDQFTHPKQQKSFY